MTFQNGVYAAQKKTCHAEKLMVNLDLNPSSSRECEGPYVQGNIQLK